MSEVSVVPSVIKHCKELSRTIREQDRQEALALGLDPIKALFFAFRHGLLRRTVLIDGKVGAIGGVTGSLLNLTGQPYLITGTEVEKVSPFTFARVYRNEIQTMKSLFPVLENYVDSRYEGAIRMLKLAGFTLTGPYPMEPYGNMFLKFSIRS